MQFLDTYQLTEFIFGALIIWVAFYLVSRNVSSKLSWITFLFLFGLGFTLFVDPIMLKTPDLRTYLFWQKMTDSPLFLSPILFLHASFIASGNKKTWSKYALVVGYILALAFVVLDIKGGLLLRENIIRYANFRGRIDGFAPGILMIPYVSFAFTYGLLGTREFYKKVKTSLWKYLLPTTAGLILTITVLLLGVAFYIPSNYSTWVYSVGVSLGTLIFIYGLVRYHLFSPAEKIIFDRQFYYKTLLIFIFILLYLAVAILSGASNGLAGLILITFIILAVFISHSLYDWFGTFINDIVFNIASGLSIVNDSEVYEAIKNYSDPAKLENSTLLRLNIISRKVNGGLLPIDALCEVIEEAVEYFKPKEDGHRRIKNYLKYQLLKMIVFDEAEEGQILWELGFEEYPVRIMSKEGESRPPLFRVNSAADYSYTSRNAYLALKREAVHDVTWRISYLEKMSKRRIR